MWSQTSQKSYPLQCSPKKKFSSIQCVTATSRLAHLDTTVKRDQFGRAKGRRMKALFGQQKHGLTKKNFNRMHRRSVHIPLSDLVVTIHVDDLLLLAIEWSKIKSRKLENNSLRIWIKCKQGSKLPYLGMNLRFCRDQLGLLQSRTTHEGSGQN